MVTLLRQHGMRFVIYTADHELPHAHVVGTGEARIEIVNLTVTTQGYVRQRCPPSGRGHRTVVSRYLEKI
jgi:hypothetical protein